MSHFLPTNSVKKRYYFFDPTRTVISIVMVLSTTESWDLEIMYR